MILRKSLATRRWAALEVPQWEGGTRVGTDWLVIDLDEDGETRSAIDCGTKELACQVAALPQLYAACLGVYHDHYHNCIDESTIEQVRAALDAANCADEPQ